MLWLEDHVLNIFQKVQLNAIDNNPDLLSHVIKSYQIILSGDYSKTNSGHKKINGIYENQEVEIYEKFFKPFLDLYKNITKQEDVNDYLNAYFTTGLVLVDGFKYKKYRNIVKSLVTDDKKLANIRSFVENADIPAIFYGQLIDYWKRLELEQGCEGKIVTPLANLEEEMIKDVKNKETELFKKFFGELLAHQEEVMVDPIKKKNYENCAHFIKIRFEWISRLFYLNKSDLANDYSQDISKCAAYILIIPKEILIKLEILEEIEGLEKLVPVPITEPPVNESYQVIVPDEELASSVTVPVPQRESGVVDKIDGVVKIVIMILSVAAGQEPFPVEVSVSVAIPALISVADGVYAIFKLVLPGE